jgi:hypothetical protein
MYRPREITLSCCPIFRPFLDHRRREPRPSDLGATHALVLRDSIALEYATYSKEARDWSTGAPRAGFEFCSFTRFIHQSGLIP